MTDIKLTAFSLMQAGNIIEVEESVWCWVMAHASMDCFQSLYETVLKRVKFQQEKLNTFILILTGFNCNEN